MLSVHPAYLEFADKIIMILLPISGLLFFLGVLFVHWGSEKHMAYKKSNQYKKPIAQIDLDPFILIVRGMFFIMSSLLIAIWIAKIVLTLIFKV